MSSEELCFPNDDNCCLKQCAGKDDETCIFDCMDKCYEECTDLLGDEDDACIDMCFEMDESPSASEELMGASEGMRMGRPSASEGMRMGRPSRF